VFKRFFSKNPWILADAKVLSKYKHYTVGDMNITEGLIAQHVLTNTVCDRLLNAKTPQREEAQAVAASLCEFRLTWKRNTQI